MSTRIYFVRHLETQKDPNKNASDWVLSDIGLEKAQALINRNLLKDIDVIYTSNEIKTVQTIEPLAKKLNLNITQIEDLGEVKRGDKFLTKEEFEIEKLRQLEDLDYPAFGGETANEALSRFEKAINKISDENKDKRIVVVSHGTILNLYFAKLKNKFHKIKERWSNTEFGAIGLVKDGKVVIDIVDIQIDYPNIKKFLHNLGLRIYNSTELFVDFSFIDYIEIKETSEEYDRLRNNPNRTDEDLLKSHEIMRNIENKYKPKLLPLVLKLKEYYKNKNTEYKFQIFLTFDFVDKFTLGTTEELANMYENNNDFEEKIKSELMDFDNYLKSEI